MADVGLFFVVPGSQLNLKEAHLAYDDSRQVGCGDTTSVEWFPKDSASGDDFDIPAREISTIKRTVSDV